MIGRAFVTFRTLSTFFANPTLQNCHHLEFLPFPAPRIVSYQSFCPFPHRELRPTRVFALFRTENYVLPEFLPFPALRIASYQSFCPFLH